VQGSVGQPIESGIAKGAVEVAEHRRYGLPPWRLRGLRTSVAVKVEPDHVRELKALAESLGLSVTETATIVLMLGLDEHDYCGLIEMMNELISRLAVYELPADFDPGTDDEYRLRARLRHRYTNYDDLLGYDGLGMICQRYVESGGVCTYYGTGTGDARIDCEALVDAYWTLKVAAIDMGMKAYDRWLDVREKVRTAD
jgi:hypothetical protein